MKRFITRTLAWLVAGLGMAATVHGQSLPSLEQAPANTFSLQPSTDWPPPPPTIDQDPRIPTAGQWQNGTSFGGWLTTRIMDGATVVAGSPDAVTGETTLIAPSDANGLTLSAVRMGRPLVGRMPTVFFGGIMSPPMVDASGNAVTGEDFLARPDNAPADTDTAGSFYYSPHSRKVYATQSGVVNVVWRFRDPGRVPQTINVQYVVSASVSPERPSRRMFWTDEGFRGPLVDVPVATVPKINIRYNTSFPAYVATPFQSPYREPANPDAAPATPTPNDPEPGRKTLYRSNTDGRLHAYNAEGRVFVEFLGAALGDGTHVPLGTEVVEVIREVTPSAVRQYIGEKLKPAVDEPGLMPAIVNGLTAQPPFLASHSVGTQVDYYTVATTNQASQSPDVPSGEVVAFWMQRGDFGLVWPRYYHTYIVTWPDTLAPGADIDSHYTRYIRQDSAEGDAARTGILMNPANNSELVFEAGPTGDHAVQQDGTLFYTRVTAENPYGYALIRHTSGSNIWYERIYSQLHTTSAGYSTAADAVVGQRIEPPAGFESALGYVRRAPAADGFKPAPIDATAYADPFVQGIAAAKAGAIIPVNTRTDDDTLTVWWYQQSTPPAGSGIQPNYFPVASRTYHLAWPQQPDRIILASNEGSGPLPAEQAASTIYYQNDPAGDGFNPNDEHALMLAGRAYALRDDLATEQTSQPWVLLRHTAADGRPAMRVFRVQREDVQAGISFTYDAEAGKVLQPPMPLPLLPPVFNDKIPANREVLPASQDMPANASAPAAYTKYTYTDRKGTVWLYRGPHSGEGRGLVQMQFYYAAQPGFYVPGDAQPAPGTPMPYLRPLNPAGPGYAGNATGVSDQPILISYRPAWPSFAPVLNLGETLTTPVRGLPAVRGNSSLEVLYDQSFAANAGSTAAVLHDPTVARTSDLSEHSLTQLPASIPGNLYRGKTYFPTLPPHLVERFYFDPDLGSKGSIVFTGQFRDETFGDDYLLINVLSADDRARLIALCDGSDPDHTKWENAINGLHAVLRPMVENREVAGTFIPAQKTLPAKRDAIWTWMTDRVGDHPKWETLTGPPVARDIRTGAGLGNGDDVNNSMRWMSLKFSQLKDMGAKQAGGEKAADELKSLKSSFRDHMNNRNPLLFIANSVADGFHSSYADWIFSGDRHWSSPEGMGISFSAFDTGHTGGIDELRVLVMREYLWSWVQSRRKELEAWDKGVTESAAVLASMRADFDKFDADATISVPAGSMAAVSRMDIPVDSYALTAAGGGTGWVVLLAGDSEALTPAEEPVSVHLLRVANPLGSGELKVLAPANPLAEKLTLQQSLDFAGKPEDYDFEWRTQPPTASGLAPAVYAFVNTSIIGDGPWTTLEADGDSGSLNLPGLVASHTGTGNAVASLSREFTLTSAPFRTFVSLDLGLSDGVRVIVNGSEVVRYRVPLPRAEVTPLPAWQYERDTVQVQPPLPNPERLPLVFEVPGSLLKPVSQVNTITIVPYTTADLGSPVRLTARLEGMTAQDLVVNPPPPIPGAETGTWIAIPPMPGETGGVGASVNGRSRFVVEGNSLFTLTDNYFICRYRAKNTSHAAYSSDPDEGWSRWTQPQLAEGWIKRALAGINPFEQRIKNLYDNDVNTDVSLITQAGKRWEGDVALNLENINDFGLIEIYETILRRGKSLSIEGTVPVNYGPANDALLLAAGYLNDLYMILGNEAASDAANPTIAFDTSADGFENGEFGDVATSLFAFKGQVATVLDEELALLRGRDDFLAPGSRVRPIYNRLPWNYTRGIDSGEAVYALNYNIKDLNSDGSVSALDAARAYPQGHGDAYGHYLTALSNYYSLLRNPYFDWIPRVESVLVLGQPVTVDYFDERKFAAAAAAWAKTATEVTELTYRAAYSPAAAGSGSWAHLRDDRTNVQTGLRRGWGTDDWASRGGQGSYFHWVAANSMLPDVDPDPAHEGIQKVDRSTVPELRVIAAQSGQMQQVLDRASAGLNPLGLSLGAVPFDISPAEVDAGRTHYEQIYARAVTALQNAATAFDGAKSATRLLRQQDSSLEEKREAIFAQERAFSRELTEIYGAPYAADIGPGKTYSQGYEGPDLVNYMYVDMPELQKNSTASREASTYYLVEDPDFAKAMENRAVWENLKKPKEGTTGHTLDLSTYDGRITLVKADHESDPWPDNAGEDAGLGNLVKYEFDPSTMFRKPAEFTGNRARPGLIQQAIGNVLLARLRLSNALEDHDHFARDAGRLFRNYKQAVEAHETAARLFRDQWISDQVFETSISVMEWILGTNDTAKELAGDIAEATKEAMPKVVGVASDATAPARSAIKLTETTTDTISRGVKIGLDAAIRAIKIAQSNLNNSYAQRAENAAWYAEHLQMLTDLKAAWESMEDRRRTTDIAIREYHNAREEMRAVIGRGQALQDERAAYRRRAAAVIHGYRTRDLGFRAFRNEALESYKSLFDLAARYSYLASRAYDYETGLLDTADGTTANQYFQSIMRSRSLGVLVNGVPQPAGGAGGDPGLSGSLARMNSDWAVVKSRLGFNNPDRYRTTFSLRREKERIQPAAAGDVAWGDVLAAARMNNILEDEDVRRYCMQINSGDSLTVPGYVIPFQTTITEGVNFFGQPLAGGDSTYSPSSFATKIRNVGIAFNGYVGMESPTSIGGAVSGAGGASPADPDLGFADPNALSATPYVYLIATGEDSMRSPAIGDQNIIRSWQVEDQAIPLPFNIGGADMGSGLFTPGQSLSETFTIRKHQAFRAVPDGTVFSSAPGFTNSRLIGRSVWNSRWKLVIPARTLLADPVKGMQIFQATVKDIKVHFETYSYSGN